MTDGLDDLAEIIDRLAARRIAWMLARQQERAEQSDELDGHSADDTRQADGT